MESLVLICISDICCIYCLTGVETLAQFPACRQDTRITPLAKAADTTTSQRVSREICAFAMLKTFLNKDEIMLAHTGMCYPCYEETERKARIHGIK